MSWSEIKKAVNSDLSKPLDTLIKEYLANSNYGLNALVSGKVPIVKSVQRGTASMQDISSLSINISSVDTSKCIVILNSGIQAGSTSTNTYAPFTYMPYSFDLTSTELSLTSIERGSSVTYSVVSWQVIEFY